jgi:hypothetical protein
MSGDGDKGLLRRPPDGPLMSEVAQGPRLDRTSQRRIGEQLRAMYDDLVQQPVPDRFKALLDKLEQSGDLSSTSEAGH